MKMYFNNDEVEELKALIENSYCCTLAGKELTYGENLEKLLLDEKAKEQIFIDLIIDYIDQLELEKEFYGSIGFNDINIIDKFYFF